MAMPLAAQLLALLEDCRCEAVREKVPSGDDPRWSTADDGNCRFMRESHTSTIGVETRPSLCEVPESATKAIPADIEKAPRLAGKRLNTRIAQKRRRESSHIIYLCGKLQRCLCRISHLYS